MDALTEITKVPHAAAATESLSVLTDDTELWKLIKNDPVTALLLSGQASTVHEAETKFLNENVEAISQMVLELAASNLSEEEFARQPLIMLRRGQGRRRWEDSLL